MKMISLVRSNKRQTMLFVCSLVWLCAEFLGGCRTAITGLTIVSQKATFDATTANQIVITDEIQMELKEPRNSLSLLFDLPDIKVQSVALDESPISFQLSSSWFSDSSTLRMDAPKLLPANRQVKLSVHYTYPAPENYLTTKFLAESPKLLLLVPTTAHDGFLLQAEVLVPKGIVPLTSGQLVKTESDKNVGRFLWRYEKWHLPVGTILVPGTLFQRHYNDLEMALVCQRCKDAEVDFLSAQAAEVCFFLESLFGKRKSHSLVIAETPYANTRGTRMNVGGIVLFQQGDFDPPFGDAWKVLMNGALAHELAHEWWGQMVFDSENDRFGLTEDLAEFSSMEFLEQKYGMEQYKKDVLLYTLDYLHLKYKHGPLSYNKSILMFVLLKHVIGADQVFQTAKELLDKFQGKQVSYSDFFTEAERVAGKRLRWILNLMFSSDQELDLAISAVRWYQEGEWWVTEFNLQETQKHFDYPLEVPLEVVTEDGAVHPYAFPIRKEPQWFSIKTRTQPTSIVVDPQWRIWDIDRSNNFFGSTVIDTVTCPKDANLRAELVGGFKDRHYPYVWSSVWIRTGKEACRVEFDLPLQTQLPKLSAWPERQGFKVVFDEGKPKEFFVAQDPQTHLCLKKKS